MDELKRRDFLKLAGMAVIAPKMLMAKNKTFITLLDIELPGDKHMLFKSLTDESIWSIFYYQRYMDLNMITLGGENIKVPKSMAGDVIKVAILKEE